MQTPHEDYKIKLTRQNLFTKTGAIVGQFTIAPAAVAAMVLFAGPLLALMPSAMLAIGALIAVAVVSMLIGNVVGRFTGMFAEYVTRPNETLAQPL